ncbi:MAG: hypothetical protein JO101_02890 [Candidatus Eremiobacteraeota bacterium]|nr:hypothetical protein [Candidatus Eremiobacteraeota bacterium]MBV8354238.1 hypothetical protein [Candidatus Eremiobacteraeota bacterium]
MAARRRFAGTLALVAAVLVSSEASADQLYRVTGHDSFQIGARDLRSDIVYDGTQTLAILHRDKKTRYVAHVSYTKTDKGASAREEGTFSSVLLPSGEQRDEGNGDPDFLTILNQPFAVQLDVETLREVTRLQQGAPFAFASPMTGGKLQGTLRHIGDGTIAGERVVGIGFQAGGPMRGSIPEHPEIVLSGTMRMSGSAYYTERGALMLALEATLTINGILADKAGSDPVTIVYHRNIRATENNEEKEAAR